MTENPNQEIIDIPAQFEKVLRLTDTKCEFFVDEKKKTVVCKYRGEIHPRNYRNNNSMFVSLFEYGIYTKGNAIETVAKIKCNEEDEFDVELGKKLAKIAAKRNALLDMQKFVATILDGAFTQLEKFRNEFWRYGMAVQREQESFIETVDNHFELKED